MISIILPIRNEANFITRSIDAILSQDFPKDRIEILIVDGMSTDETRKIVQVYQQNHPQIHIIDNPKKIVPTALNAAILHAKGEIIIRVDGHTIIAPDYLRQCVATLSRTSADNVGGKMNAVGSNPFGKAVALATSSPFGIGGGRFHYSEKEEWVDTVYMGAWPRKVFKEIGLFDEDLVRDQDDEFNYRLREHGGRILLNPNIKSEYTVRSNPKSLWKQYFQYGYWKIRVLQKHPKQMSLRQFIPPAFVISIIACITLFLSFSWGWIPFTLIAGSYIIANLVASIIVSSNKGWKHLLRLPLVFAILHLSYGTGFLIGLFKFWNRWGDKVGKVPTL